MNLLRPRNRPACRQAGRISWPTSSESSTGVGAGFTGDPRTRPCGPGSPKGFGSYRGPARIYARLHGLATIPGEKCGLAIGRASAGRRRYADSGRDGGASVGRPRVGHGEVFCRPRHVRPSPCQWPHDTVGRRGVFRSRLPPLAPMDPRGSDWQQGIVVVAAIMGTRIAAKLRST